MSYQEVLENLKSTADRDVRALYGDLESGEISEEQFIGMAVVLMSVANEQGRIAAEVAFMGWQEVNGIPPAPLAVRPNPHYRSAVRFEASMRTIFIGRGGQQIERVTRLVSSETVAASQDTFAELMKTSRDVDGWVRVLDSEPCNLCVRWSEGGKVFPAGVRMRTHNGCTCTQIPQKKKVTEYV